MYVTVVLLGTILATVEGLQQQRRLNLYQPRSCADIYKNNKLSTNGTYLVYNLQHQSHHVTCEFHHGYGYTYIDPSSNVTININDLYTDSSHVLIRDLRKDGHQYVSRVEQMTAYRQYNLSIQFNAHVGYAEPQNHNMLPYFYVGFLPNSVAGRLGARQGYRVNGVDYAFTNCDANPNSYFAFLGNHKHIAAAAYHPSNNPLVHHWDTTAKLITPAYNLPASYFTFFEIHFGGCGGYATTANFPNVVGAALGLRFDITCQEPGPVANAAKTGGGTAVGSVVRYTCNLGYTLLKGNAVRQCVETGQYTGQPPFCGQQPCDSMPCQNGGMCFANGNSFVCECTEGYLGQFCEQQIL